MFIKSFHSILFLILLVDCADFPKDPEKSFAEAEVNDLKVGLIENPPYVNIQNNQYSGIEIRLVEEFARRNNLDIQFIEGSESELIKKLEAFQLHILAGGFEKNTNWISKAGLSASYDGRHVFLVPKGENKLLYRLEKHIYEIR